MPKLAMRSLANGLTSGGGLKRDSTALRPATNPPLLRDYPFWAALLASLAVFAACLYRGSLWIDEGYTAWLTHHSSLPSLIATLSNKLTNPADRQYPLYALWIFSWAHCFGTSELALRSANLPFAALYVFAIALTSRSIIGNRYSWIPFAFSPFAWYYTSEARSYLMLMAFAAAAVASALFYIYQPWSRRVSVWIFSVALLLTILVNVLGFMLYPGLLTLFFLEKSRIRRPGPAYWALPSLIIGTLSSVVLVYYVATVAGSGAHSEFTTNRRSAPAIAFAGQALYEQVGLDGLGPPRNSLRLSGASGAKSFIPWLLLGASLLAVAVIVSLREKQDRRFWPLINAWIVAFALAVLLSAVTETRFLGRHMAAIFPLLVFALLFLCKSRLAFAAFSLAFLLSDYRLTFLPEYWKDDYRAAVHEIIERVHTAPGSVDWAADGLTANYYGLAVSYPGSEDFEKFATVDYPVLGHATSARDLDSADVMRLLVRENLHRRPIYLALSKANVYDKKGGWHDAVSRLRPILEAEFREFTIYLFR